ncbi:hypothetical protein PHMEG_00039442, partial [Phytophthora megakarya]
MIPRDPERKRLREAGSPIVAARETEITKIETAVLIVGPGNKRIWIVGSAIQRIAVCMRVVDAGTYMRQEIALSKSSTTGYANDMIRLVTPGCSPNKPLAGGNPVRAERSRYCIYATVNKATRDRGRKESGLRGNTCNLHSYTAKIASLPHIGEFSRFNAEISKEESPGDIGNFMHRENGSDKLISRVGSIKKERSCAYILALSYPSWIPPLLVRKMGCNFDTSQRQECVGIGDNVYTTEGRTRIKITLAGYLVYFFHIWIGDLSGQNAILGMDSMVPVG